jgi:predicted permease
MWPRLLTLVSRLGFVVTRRRLDEEARAELDAHLELLVDRHVQAGMTVEQARAAARRQFGNLTAIREDVHQMNGIRWLDGIGQDLRIAARSLRRTPAFAVAAILTFALGIGANTAIFSLLNAVTFRTLPIDRPGDLWLLYQSMPPAVSEIIGGTDRSDIFSYQAFARMERAARPQGIRIAAMSDSLVRLSLRIGANQTSVPVSAQLVSGGFFQTVGITPAAGRLLTADDDNQMDGEPVAVLRYGFAQQVFGDVAAAVGRTIPINDALFTVIGVMPNGFSGLFMNDRVDVYVPTMMQHVAGYRQNVASHNAETSDPWIPQGGVEWLNVIARGAGASVERAQETLARAYREEVRVEADRRGDTVETRRWQESLLARESFAGGRSVIREQFSNPLLILMGMVAVLLLVACANISNLLLARAVNKRSEMAIRLSLGAGRMRIIRQLLVETLLLAGIGIVVAVPLGHWASLRLAEMAAVRGSLPPGFSLDSRVLVFSMVLTLATALMAGLIPAWRVTRVGPATDLKGAGTGRVLTGTRPMGVLVAAQIGLCVVLVATAALLGRSLLNLWSFDPGFERQQLLSVRLNTPDVAAFRPEEIMPLREEVLRRTRAVPGVLAAEVSATGTVTGTRRTGGIRIEGYEPGPGEQVRAQANHVGPEYFDTVRMTLHAGRLITDRDVAGSGRVAVVNESFARRYFSERNPIGKRVSDDSDDLDTEIVGVVADARVDGLRATAVPMVFYPLAQRGVFPPFLDVRVMGDPAIVGAAARRALIDVDARVVVGDVTPIQVALNRGIRRDRLVAFVSFGFGAVALVLACVGVYGVLTYTVARRTQELGIRAALGAAPAQLLRHVLSAGLRMVGPGLALGTAAALAGARILQSQLFGVSPYDLSTHLAVVTLLLLSSLVACYLPARRAAAADPAVALRAE